MDTSAWFDDLPVLGEFSLDDAATALRDMGDDETADMLEAAQEAADVLGTGQGEVFGNRPPGYKSHAPAWWPFQDRPWQYTSHTYGYLAPTQPNRTVLPICSLTRVSPDQTLVNARVKITLDRLYVAAYPGRDRDTHLILVHFAAKNQLSKKAEDVYFNITCQARNGEYADLRNFPIFVGLNIGSEGIVFGGFTLNVSNTQDETFLKFLQSDVFKTGLQLTTAAQPVLAPFLVMAKAVAEMITVRNRKRLVQKIGLGLDFGTMPIGARLAEGAYIAVQISGDAHLNWNEWVYHRGMDQIVKKDDYHQTIPFNYFVFGISRYRGP